LGGVIGNIRKRVVKANLKDGIGVDKKEVLSAKEAGIIS
jgi:hypothetical protein